MRIFLAGASGVIGRRLTVLLRNASYEVVGTTRSQAKAAALQALGAKPVVVDVFDAAALRRAVADAQPDIVIHQLTDLPQEANLEKLAGSLNRNARLRINGTKNLIDAMLAADVRRLIAQSISFVYAPGEGPRRESDPLATDFKLKNTVEGVTALERLTTQTPGIDGTVLRYGRLYGPGTWFDRAHGEGPLHVDAAAQAALQAVIHGKLGIYNIAEDDGTISTEKAKRELEFDPDFRLSPSP